jgi:hypothetical protein
VNELGTTGGFWRRNAKKCQPRLSVAEAESAADHDTAQVLEEDKLYGSVNVAQGVQLYEHELKSTQGHQAEQPIRNWERFPFGWSTDITAEVKFVVEKE